ncbi:MAG: hypothetical protein LBJ11_00695 [Oscillospiraceae bacterium]|jgi:hypothetical protein|nr:hypothetical protein [Oscillospiraceae bacterium]
MKRNPIDLAMDCLTRKDLDRPCYLLARLTGNTERREDAWRSARSPMRQHFDDLQVEELERLDKIAAEYQCED